MKGRMEGRYRAIKERSQLKSTLVEAKLMR